jgi:hypothetical protein
MVGDNLSLTKERHGSGPELWKRSGTPMLTTLVKEVGAVGSFIR